MVPLTLYSAAACPYAQRTRICLMEKGVEHDLVEIDLSDKPAWFAEVSPYGKVPVLQRGKDRVWESRIINQYLEEVYPDPPLLPRDPGERALARIWMDFADSRFTPAFYRVLTTGEGRECLREHLEFLEARVLERADPFWSGRSFGMVDLTYAPWLVRWCVLEHYRGVRLPEGLPRLRRWREAVGNRESVRSTSGAPEFYLQAYRRYGRAGGESGGEEASAGSPPRG